MSTDTTARRQKRRIPPVWQGALAGIVLLNLIERVTEWSWWAYRAPMAAIAVIAVAYYWIKKRRQEAAEAAAGG